MSLPAQVAAVAALEEGEYYKACWEETRRLRRELRLRLEGEVGLQVHEGDINALLCELPPGSLPAEEVVRRCRRLGVYLRNAETFGRGLADSWIRIAVKGAEDNQRIVEALRAALGTAA